MVSPALLLGVVHDDMCDSDHFPKILQFLTSQEQDNNLHNGGRNLTKADRPADFSQRSQWREKLREPSEVWCQRPWQTALRGTLCFNLWQPWNLLWRYIQQGASVVSVVLWSQAISPQDHIDPQPESNYPRYVHIVPSKTKSSQHRKPNCPRPKRWIDYK